MFLRNSVWTKRFLEDVEEVRRSSNRTAMHKWGDQIGFMRLVRRIRKKRVELHRLVVFPQRAFNAYPLGTPGMDDGDEQAWHAGDLLVHFAGCGDDPRRNCTGEFLEYFQLQSFASERDISTHWCPAVFNRL
mmetsp:Transcript_27670/g.65626  ORF Transcript_27670/g.65626 Transcript_27670/m.65626 type:complete len:132 (-) Transcript_27670:135-530(-)